MITFRGGKRFVADQFVDWMPRAEMFIDVFGGSGALSFAAVQSGKFNQVVYNDIDNRMVNFLMQCRDNTDLLIDRIERIPIGRHFQFSLKTMLESDDEIENACGVFYALNWTGRCTTDIKNATQSVMRPGVRNKNSVVHGYQHRDIQVDKLKSLTKTLLKIYFENKDAMKLVEQYGAHKRYWGSGDVKMVFVFDPPYGNSLQYHHTDYDHDGLIDFFITTTNPVAWFGDSKSLDRLLELDDVWAVKLVGKNGRNISTFAKANAYEQYVVMRNCTDRQAALL